MSDAFLEINWNVCWSHNIRSPTTCQVLQYGNRVYDVNIDHIVVHIDNDERILEDLKQKALTPSMKDILALK